MKKKRITTTDLRDLWLNKYHNTNSQEVALKHPEASHTPDWFKLYPCTREQSDEWVIEAKKLLKQAGYSKFAIEHDWGFIYLDTAPHVPNDYENEPYAMKYYKTFYENIE